MPGRRGDAGLLLDISHNLEPILHGHIFKVTVISDKPFPRQVVAGPFLLPAPDPGLKSGEVGTIESGLTGIQSRERCGHTPGNFDHILHRQMVVRVPHGMDITQASIQCRLLFDSLDKSGAVKMAGAPRLNGRIRRCFDDPGQIADFQVQTIVYEDVRISCGQDHTRLRFDLMRILTGLDEHLHIHPLSSQVTGHAADPGKCGHHLEFTKDGGGENAEKKKKSDQFFHPYGSLKRMGPMGAHAEYELQKEFMVDFSGHIRFVVIVL